METIGVDCRFGTDGRVQVNKVLLNGRWLPVGQGRQWADENGRHVLIMLPNDEVRELVLHPGTLCWSLVEKKVVGGGKAV